MTASNLTADRVHKKYFNVDGSVKQRGSKLSGGGKQSYSVFGWNGSTKDSVPTGMSTAKADSQHISASYNPNAQAAGIKASLGAFCGSPHNRPGSARRLDDIKGNNIFSDGKPFQAKKVGSRAEPEEEEERLDLQIHKMKMDTIQGHDVFADTPDCKRRGRPVSANMSKNLFTSTVFSISGAEGPKVRCTASAQKYLEMNGSKIFTPADPPPPRRHGPNDPKGMPHFDTPVRPKPEPIPVGGTSLVSFG